jgi:putative ABC transport system permease protein
VGVLRSLRGVFALVRASLRTERASSLVLFTLVAVTAAMAASVPKLIDRVGEEGLDHHLGRATSVDRNLVFLRQTRKLIDAVTNPDGSVRPADGDPLAAVERVGDELASVLPPMIAQAAVERSFVVDTHQYLGVRAPRSITHLRLRYQSGLDDRIRYVEGRPPTSRTIGPDCPADGECQMGAANPPVTYEVALSRDMADALLLETGDVLGMQVEAGVPAIRPGIPPTDGDSPYIGIVVTGIFEMIDRSDDYWLRDTTLERPNIQPVSIELANYYGAALVARETYRELPGPIRYTYQWRFRLEPDQIAAASLGQFERDLRRLEAQYPVRPPASTDEVPSLGAGLSRVLATYRAQRGSTEAVVAFISVGPLTAVIGSVALIALFWMQRRRANLLYLRQRGGTSLQAIGRAFGEALVLVVPASIVGFAVSTGFVAGSPIAAAAWAAAAGIVALLVCLAASVPGARAADAAAGEDGHAGRTGSGRLLVELFIALLAVVAAWSLVQRGAVGPTGDVDLLPAAAPALIGVATGLMLLRLYPLPIRAIGALFRRRRGLVAAHALRASAREAGLARLPLLVLLLASALAVFSSAVLVTLERGQLASSWQQMGADYRIEARFGDVIPAELDPGQVAGVTVATRAFAVEAVLSGGRTRREGIPMLAIDPAGYGALLAGTPAEITLPASFEGPWPERVYGRPVGEAIGNQGTPLPAVVSSTLAQATGATIGDQLDLTIPGGRTVVRVDAIRSAVPGLAPDSDFLLLPWQGLRPAYPDRPLQPTQLLVRGEASADAELRAVVQPFDRRVGMTSRHALYDELHHAPLARAITAGLALALAVTLAYGAIALAASSLMSLLARRREIVLLRTLGTRPRQLVGMLLLGQLPGVVAALSVGLLLGLGLALLLLPSLRLEAFTGPGVTVSLQLEPAHLVVAAVLPAVAALGLTVVGGWLMGRGSVAAIIRGGDGPGMERH